MRKFTLMIFIVLFSLSGCGGSGSGGDNTGNNPPPPPPPPANDGVTVSGKVVYGGSDTESSGKVTMRRYKMNYVPTSKVASTVYSDMMDACAVPYSDLFNYLTPNSNTGTVIVNITRSVTTEGETPVTIEFIAENVDVDIDSQPDLNIQVMGSIPGFEFMDYMDFDTDCDGEADLNVDQDSDGIPDTNIDESGDGIGDYDIVDVNLSTIEGAVVNLVNEGTGESYNSDTDTLGVFLFENVKTGVYQLEVTKDAVDELGQPVVLWNRNTVVVETNAQDLGVYPLDTGPYVKTILTNGIDNYAYFGGRNAATDSANFNFGIGAVVSWDLQIIDPNNRQIFFQFKTYGDPDGDGTNDYYTQDVAGTPVEGSPGVYNCHVTATLQDEYYDLNICGFTRQLVPRYVGDRDMRSERFDCWTLRYDLCDPSIPLNVNWNDVQSISLEFAFSNGDNLKTWNGADDGRLGLTMWNTSYTYNSVDDAPIVHSVTVNGQVHDLDAIVGEKIVDLGDIRDQTTLNISFDVEADEAYPVGYDWILPSTLYPYEPGNSNTAVINVDDLPRVYPSLIYFNRLYFTASYKDGSTDYSTGEETVSIVYDVAGDARPAACEDISVNGSDGNNSEAIYYVGQTISLQAIVSDPNGLPIEVAFRRSWEGDEADSYITGFNEVTGEMQYVPASEIVNYTLTADDNTDTFNITLYCRNNDGFGVTHAGSEDGSHSELLNISE